ncbi:hypothetical protein GCM10020216_097670 [Nonomuraea helvata]
MFNDEMLRRCQGIMIEVCDSFEAELREFNGEDDHVHPTEDGGLQNGPREEFSSGGR